ncbi:MAG TPA: hypothetical protein VMR52_06455 [Dehalococcoidia bacterium]|nr:hypothetical protein [Dehalococcoidia bacterium]
MRIWLQFMGLLTRASGKAKVSPEEMAQRMAAVLQSIGEQILPPEPG